jgi:hypothetical protein
LKALVGDGVEIDGEELRLLATVLWRRSAQLVAHRLGFAVDVVGHAAKRSISRLRSSRC